MLRLLVFAALRLHGVPPIPPKTWRAGWRVMKNSRNRASGFTN